MTNQNSTKPHAASSSADTAIGKMEQDTRSAAEVAKHDLEHVTDEIRKDASSVVDATKEQLASISHDAEDMANQRKDSLADSLDGVAGAMRKAADDLAEQSGPGADLTRQLAGRVGQLSKTLKGNDIGGLIGITEDFGRRQPAAFLGASVLLGFAASRFAVASSHRKRPATGQNTQSNPTRPINPNGPGNGTNPITGGAQ